ncbi:MAG: hypothetical protein K1060chlam2_00969 [Chlamydiae bacterium]|nr:hypothetical protein [Chlamydiota bacterium]
MDKTKTTIHTMGTIILIYSILVFAGGLMGFIMKKSLPSLMGGGLFGLSLVFTSIQTFALRKWGLYASLMLILLLDAFFSYRFLTTHTFFPSGVMLLISTGTLLILVLKLKKLDALPKKTLS